MAEDYSVLMSVYHKEKAEYLRESMQSMFDQTVPTNDFVLVCDGPLTPELDRVIEELQKSHGELNVVRLEKNVGLGRALNEGMKKCKNMLIARMDSDDISRTDRCEKQLKIFCDFPALSICGGIVEEFIENNSNVVTSRVLPENSIEISRYAKRRNPFNHPCVMYKKDDVVNAGGYKDFYLLEDYYLWVRMIMKGCKGYNLQEPLLWMRVGSDLYKRRGGWRYAKSQKRLFSFMLESEFISRFEYLYSVIIRTTNALSPNCVRKIVYNRLLRKKRSNI